jgi:hypothetical protein
METTLEITIEVVEHKEQWKKEYGSWGNGYVEIPKCHPIYKHIISRVDDWGFCDVLCGEEITYNSETKNGYIIGFDTLHAYNGKHNTKQWVVAKCNEIKDYLNSKQYLDVVIKQMKDKYHKIAAENCDLQMDIYKLERYKYRK